MTIEEFQKIDLRVGKIIVAEKIKNSDKLLRLEVDLGNEWRQIVSGIADKYKPEDLINKQIIIVANLESKKIKGIESQGMILAAEDENGNLALIVPNKEIKNGSVVK
ncbi:MAG: methionine--tRNA ligase subunit beta [Patescibacteria group bacterium]|nr:methionine--tRNA ligase subunit beta [Patescibacteria group bacterium]MDW8279764.1 methionine--tRNA ligase subunit beta [bacterium]